MTLDEARAHIGDGVVYTLVARDHPLKADGVITSVNRSYVFVRYTGDTGTKATYAENLSLLNPDWK